jgi:DNA-directed RNA polymerase specialized sigma24 family protein
VEEDRERLGARERVGLAPARGGERVDRPRAPPRAARLRAARSTRRFPSARASRCPRISPSAFERALLELPDGQRTVFLLRHEGGLTLAEVADALGVAVPTAKTQFARACLKLQEKLAPFQEMP